MMRWLLPVVIVFAIRAQAPLTFEVASVKPSDEASRTPMSWNYDGGRVSYTHANLKVLVMDAYNVPYHQLDAPSWFETQHYDVAAKLPVGALQDQVPAMLQALLIDRFRMVLHWETRQESGFVLVAGKNGAKLHNTSEPGDTAVKESSGHIAWQRVAMARFAQSLSGLTGRPVVDQTGFDGRFDIALDLSGADLPGLRNIDPADASPSGGSVFAALEAIGLKLESRKLPIRHLVIDHTDRVPTEN
jgi:uncharacterized protein (TIGR03435 family)